MLSQEGPQGTCSSAWAEVGLQATVVLVEVLLWCIPCGVTASCSWDGSSPAVVLSEGHGSREVRREQFPMLPFGVLAVKSVWTKNSTSLLFCLEEG